MSFFHKSLVPYYIVFGLICILCRNHIFFWETYQLCGKQAWALYENGLFNWILPSEIDSGHPSLFGFYHAALWKLLHPSLVVSHLAMFPFSCGIVYLLFRLGAHYIDKSNALFLLPFLLADPVFMGQSVLASPDIVLIFFMLMCWVGIVQKSIHMIWLAAIGLGMISMRGMMVLAAFILFDFFVQQKEKDLKIRICKMLRYLPAIALVITFLAYHYLDTGWLGHHQSSSWAESFNYVDFSGGLRNLAVYVWRECDFGRVFLILALIYLGILWSAKQEIKKEKELISILLILILIISPILIVHKGLVLHRYMFPLFLTTSVLFWYLLFSLDINKRIRNGILSLVLIGMLSGNLWVYPRQISQIWDATLGHLPYYHLRDDMIAYLDQNNIPLVEVGTAFPNIGLMKYYDPDNDRQGFSAYNLDQDNYVFFSNIFNDFSDEELDRLELSEWRIEKSLYFYPIEIILYKKNK